MRTTRTIAAAIALALALAMSAAGHAQPFGGPGFGGGMGYGAGHGPMSTADRLAVMEARLSDLKVRLGITRAQEAAWTAFANQAKQQAQAMQSLRERMWSSAGTAPERMARRNEMMEQRIDAMNAMSEAFNALYAVLTPAQKAIADQGFGMMGPRGMRYGGRAG